MVELKFPNYFISTLVTACPHGRVIQSVNSLTLDHSLRSVFFIWLTPETPVCEPTLTLLEMGEKIEEGKKVTALTRFVKR